MGSESNCDYTQAELLEHLKPRMSIKEAIAESIAKSGVPVYVAPARGSGKSNRDLERLVELMDNGFEIIPYAKLKGE